MKNKFLKLFSLVFIFMMGFSNVSTSFAKSILGTQYYSTTPPTKMELAKWDDNPKVQEHSRIPVGKIVNFSQRTKESVHKDLDESNLRFFIIF